MNVRGKNVGSTVKKCFEYEFFLHLISPLLKGTGGFMGKTTGNLCIDFQYGKIVTTKAFYLKFHLMLHIFHSCAHIINIIGKRCNSRFIVSSETLIKKKIWGKIKVVQKKLFSKTAKILETLLAGKYWSNITFDKTSIQVVDSLQTFCYDIHRDYILMW